MTPRRIRSDGRVIGLFGLSFQQQAAALEHNLGWPVRRLYRQKRLKAIDRGIKIASAIRIQTSLVQRKPVWPRPLFVNQSQQLVDLQLRVTTWDHETVELANMDLPCRQSQSLCAENDFGAISLVGALQDHRNVDSVAHDCKVWLGARSNVSYDRAARTDADACPNIAATDIAKSEPSERALTRNCSAARIRRVLGCIPECNYSIANGFGNHTAVGVDLAGYQFEISCH